MNIATVIWGGKKKDRERGEEGKLVRFIGPLSIIEKGNTHILRTVLRMRNRMCQIFNCFLALII